MWKAAGAMVSVCLSAAFVNILFKNGLNGGMDRVIMIVYVQAVATIFLIPFVFFWERSSWNKLTPSLIGQMFLGALLGLTLAQYLFFVGLQYTSAAFACAFTNLVPVITFVVALPLGMEKVEMGSKRGKAKVLGTLVCVGGVLILSLYKGAVVVNPRQYSAGGDEHHVRAKRFGAGAALLAAGNTARSSWFILQTRIGLEFSHVYSCTTIMSLFSSLQATLLFFIITDRNLSKWILPGELQILSVVFSGVVGAGLCFVVMAWCVKRRGPVFTAAFAPLVQVFAAFLDVLVLHEEIYLGSILGSVAVIVGMYILLWGKNKDRGQEDSAQCQIINHQH